MTNNREAEAMTQVMDSETAEFRGELTDQHLRTCSFEDFLDSRLDRSDNCQPDNQDSNKHCFLAQCSMWDRKDRDSAPLAHLLEDVALPKCLRRSPALSSVNLWVSGRHAPQYSLSSGECIEGANETRELICCQVQSSFERTEDHCWPHPVLLMLKCKACGLEFHRLQADLGTAFFLKHVQGRGQASHMLFELFEHTSCHR